MRDSKFSFFLFSLKPQTGRVAGKTEPQAPIAVSWPTSASQGGVIFLNSLSEKQMTDALFELCNQEQAGVTNCSVYWTSIYFFSYFFKIFFQALQEMLLLVVVLFIAKKKKNPREEKITEVHIIIDNIALIIQVHGSIPCGAVLGSRRNV